jgi:ketosteroid isomerase-like protein
MRRAWLASLSAWDDFRAEPDEFIDSGPHVVVLTRIHAWGKGSGAEVSADTAAVFTLDGGKVARLVLYWDTTKALAAVGPRD